jgi:hypothetical protein
MRLLLVIFLLIPILALAQAQDSTSVKQENKGIIHTVREKINNIKSGFTSPVDSTKQTLTSKSDSLQNVPQDSLKRLNAKTGKPLDSLRQLSQKISDKISSPVKQVNEKIDSLEQKLNAPINKVNQKISDAEKQVQDKIGLGEGGVNGKIDGTEKKLDNAFSKATDGKVKRPGEDLNLDAEKLGKQTPAINALNGKDLPGLQDQKIPGTENLKLPDTKLNVDALKQKENVKIPGQDKIKEVTGGVQNLDSKLAKGESYETEIRQVAKGDLTNTEKLSDLAEDKAMKVEQIKLSGAELQKAAAQQERYAAMMKKMNDPKALEREMELKAMNVVSEQINMDNPIVKQSVNEIAAIKKIKTSAQGFNGDSIKRVNALKGKSFRDHFVPGLTIQVNRFDKTFTFDWGLQAAYKFSNRFRAGTAVTFQTSFNEDYQHWVKWDRVYGFRTFLNVDLIKTFYAHCEYDLHLGRLDIKLPEAAHQHSQTGFIGLGKRYDISPRFKGSALILYHARFDNNMPLVSKLAMRIEFNINTRKVEASNWKQKLKEGKKKSKQATL